MGEASGDEHVAPVGLRLGQVRMETCEVAGGKVEDGEVDALAVVVDQGEIGRGESGTDGRGFGGREGFFRLSTHEGSHGDFHGRDQRSIYST